MQHYSNCVIYQKSYATQSLDQSQHWEEVDDDPSSMQSSYPSLSYPENSDQSSSPKTPPPKSEKPKETEHPKEEGSHRQANKKDVVAEEMKEDPSLSLTLSVFDSGLSSRSRIFALISAFSINVALPFVNGVMLGFGEIFARSLLRHWGWNVPGMPLAPTAVGLASTRSRR